MSKQLIFDYDARIKLMSGIDKTVNALKSTLGPTGKTVLLERGNSAPATSRDGISITKEIELPDPFENMGAKLINEIAEKTSEEVGDGTATAAIMAQTIFSEGLKCLSSGGNPVAIKAGLDKSCSAAVEDLKKNARPIKDKSDIQFVATVAANNDSHIGSLIADAIEKVGKEGIVTVEESNSTETILEFAEGMQLDKGYVSPYFVTNVENLTCVMEDAYVLCYDKKISNIQEILELLEKISRVGKSLLIICDEVEGEALTVLVLNKMRGSLRVCAIKAPAFGDRKKAILEDIAVMTGGNYISEELGIKLEKVTLEHLGIAKKVIVEKEKSTIIGSDKNKKAIEERCAQLRHQIKETTSNYDREKLEERLAKLIGGVAVIKVGGITEAEMKDKKPYIQSAVDAALAANEEGIVAGGGTALLKIRKAVEALKLEGDEEFGKKILMKALEMPLYNIAVNSGFDGNVTVAEAKTREGNIGFNAVSGEFTDLFTAGVIDPAKTLRVAIQNAVSIAGLLLASNTLIADLKDKKKAIENAVS